MNLSRDQAIQYAAYDGTQKDSRGNIIDSWATPVEVAVHSWHISGTHEPQIAGHDRVLVDAQVFGPVSWVPSPKDKVVLPGRPGEYQVIGEVEDYNHGPFTDGWPLVVNLRKVTG